MATDTSLNDGNSSEDNPERLKLLYPAVDEEETPLPRTWSPKDKFSFIGLSHNNLRVHYKGTGKTHKDAASVRATHPIPASCGIYYFEVKVISKGRDGYMGIGLSTQGVSTNRLPGWDKYAYGYHGDDGNSFCSSNAGQPYGPTFTTGDTIGCCLNLIDKSCFYTKNGVNLGVAFTDLPTNLYPTVGLQTPGEVVEANFGQLPFMFDITDYMNEWKMKTQQAIERFSVSDKKGEFQSALQKIVSTYLVHHGYCSSAEAFSKSTGQPIMESIESIRNRQRVQKLVLAGRMGEAIETTQKLYPHLLDTKPDLLFMLKCRQFVEMVNGTDSEVRFSRTTPMSFATNNVGSSSSSLSYSNPLHAGNSHHPGSSTSKRSSSRGSSPKSYHGGGGGGDHHHSGHSNRSSPAHSPHPYYIRSNSPSNHHNPHHHTASPPNTSSSSPHRPGLHSSAKSTPTHSACSSPNRLSANKSPTPLANPSSSPSSSQAAANSNNNLPTQSSNNTFISSSSSITPTTCHNSPSLSSTANTTSTTTAFHTSSSPLQQHQQPEHNNFTNNGSLNGNSDNSTTTTTNNNVLSSSSISLNNNNGFGANSNSTAIVDEAAMNSVNNNSQNQFSKLLGPPPRFIQEEEEEGGEGDGEEDVDMEKTSISNGKTSYTNGVGQCHDGDEQMDVDVPSSQQTLMCGGNEVAIERMLEFGRDLKMMSQRLRKDYGKNESNKKTLQDAFSLLAYSDPWNSPIGAQLLPVKREPVCAALNSAILESKGLPKQPPLELALAQANQCVNLMAKSGIASCAFASVSDYLH